MRVHPGALNEAWFDATNRRAAGASSATPRRAIAPNKASLYFNKTECFCFTEQMLNAGESRRMPVRFIVDPTLPADVGTMTLSLYFLPQRRSHGAEALPSRPRRRTGARNA